jgi:hypothetical protein
LNEWDRSRGRQPPSGEQASDEGPSADEQMQQLRIQVARHRRMIQRKAARDATTARQEVSQPGDAAEVEADAVADHVADALHSGAKQPAKTAQPAKEQAPKIGAKLNGPKIHLAGKDPLRGHKKDEVGEGPEADAVHVGNAVQAGVQQSPQHHVFPQQHRDWFADRGVNVDDFCITLPQDHHEAVHAKPPKGAKGKDAEDAKQWEWNAAVMTALQGAEKARGRKLTLKDMLAIVQPLMATHGIAGKFEKYKGDKK